MTTIELNIDSATDVGIQPNNSRFVSLTFVASSDDVCECLDEKTVVDYFGEDKILEHIGVDAVKKYFGLIEEE